MLVLVPCFALPRGGCGGSAAGWAAHLTQWCWKAVRRRYAAWTQAARVGATAGREGAAEAAEEAAEAAAEEEERLLGCI